MPGTMNSIGVIFPVIDNMNASCQGTCQVRMANGIERRNSPRGVMAVRKVRTKSISISVDHYIPYIVVCLDLDDVGMSTWVFH